MKTLFVLIFGLIASIYLLNPGFGFIEIIPDNWPFIGNLDEAGATVLLLNCFRYFGLDIANLFATEKPENVIEV